MNKIKDCESCKYEKLGNDTSPCKSCHYLSNWQLKNSENTVGKNYVADFMKANDIELNEEFLTDITDDELFHFTSDYALRDKERKTDYRLLGWLLNGTQEAMKKPTLSELLKEISELKKSNNELIEDNNMLRNATKEKESIK